MKIVVSEIIPVRDDGCLLAWITLQIGPLTIYQCRWVQQPGQRGFCQPPQEVIPGEAGGRPRYRPLLKWPAEWSALISAAVEEAMRDHPSGLRQLPPTKSPASEFGQEVYRRAGIGGGR